MSAIVTGADRSRPVADLSLFDDDLEENVDEEILLLNDFGPSSFNSHLEEPDEENDVQLWLDAIESIKEWQENKLLKQKLKLSHR